MHRRLRWIAIAGIAVAIAGCTSFPSGGWASGPPSTAQPDVASAGGATGSAVPAMPMASMDMGGSATGVSSAGTIAIDAFDLGFKPGSQSVAAAGTYHVSFHNTGVMTHDLTFADGTKLVAESGKTVTGEVTVPAAGMTFLCSIPGHAAAGMSGAITVGGGTASASAAPGAGTGAATAAAPVADPNAAPYVLRNATAPTVLPGTVHDVDMPIVDKDITVAEASSSMPGRSAGPSRARRSASTSATPCGST